MIPNIYLSDEQILDLEEEVEDAVFCGRETLTKPHLIAKAAAENAVKQVVEQFEGYKQLAGKRIYITAEHPDEYVELEEPELSVVIVVPIDDWQALQKLAGDK